MQNKVLGLGRAAFHGCSSLEKIHLSTALTRINDWTFASCSRLSTISIPSSVTLIDDNAFRLTNLKEVNIPEGVTSIGIMAFSFENYSMTKSLVIPSTVTEIGSEAFDYMFESGSNLSVTVLAVNPPTIKVATSQWVTLSYLDLFYARWFMPNYVSIFASDNYPVYVPAESVNAYKTTEGWKDIASRIYPISE